MSQDHNHPLTREFHHEVHPPHGGEEAHSSLRIYLIGFVLSVILTAIPFYLVMTGRLHSAQATSVAIMGLAAVQIVVHVFCFLHVDAKAEGGWTLMALIFTVVMLVIVLTGSLWVMYHLNENMMPGMGSEQRSSEPLSPQSSGEMP